MDFIGPSFSVLYLLQFKIGVHLLNVELLLKQTNKQKVSREIPKVYLFSCRGRLLSSVRCDKETRDEHQTKKARALGKSENLS